MLAVLFHDISSNVLIVFLDTVNVKLPSVPIFPAFGTYGFFTGAGVVLFVVVGFFVVLFEGVGFFVVFELFAAAFGTFSFCPTFILVVFRLFSFFRLAVVVLYFFAIFARVSPFLTVYVLVLLLVFFAAFAFAFCVLAFVFFAATATTSLKYIHHRPHTGQTGIKQYRLYLVSIFCVGTLSADHQKSCCRILQILPLLYLLLLLSRFQYAPDFQFLQRLRHNPLPCSFLSGTMPVTVPVWLCNRLRFYVLLYLSCTFR
uniref:Uncharacterized protein n=1 Tax=Caudovirales sp. ctvQY7 TaxID=2825774 RepID=A0A8S5UFQ6_9CAUD|nr:MAG TPA: hypothetical protein [Caudovirales sp. ctvQY7]